MYDPLIGMSSVRLKRYNPSVNRVAGPYDTCAQAQLSKLFLRSHMPGSDAHILDPGAYQRLAASSGVC